MSSRVRFDRGVFTLSLDLELLWGTLDLYGPSGFRDACEVERREIVDRLLDLFAEFEIPATWCVLGHLFLDHCAAAGGVKHPEIILPPRSRASWFEHDPCGDERRDPLFYGRSLIEKIRRCRVPQEIGSHSFSHVIFDDCSRETAASELAACVRAAREMGIELRSFVFPRNRIGHLDSLSAHGFACYRGPEPSWYEREPLPAAAKRLGHLADVLRAAEPPVVLPQRTAEGLWNVPASMMYFPMHGLRRHVPPALRVRRAFKGLRAAARHRAIFHLWFHPTNFADETEAMFQGLREILADAASRRKRGEIEIVPMGAVAERAALLAA